MTWIGISRGTTPVDQRLGVSEFQANTRMKVVNELQRRWGFQSSAIAQQDGPILGIVSANGVTGNFLTFDLGGPALGQIDGFSPPPDQPPGPKRRKPIVGEGVPQPPVINFMISVPGEGLYGPPPYPVFVITPNITYDGLSGPLTYLWELINVVDATPLIVDPTAEICTLDATASNDGVFEVQLTVTASFNPAMNDQANTITYIFIP